MPDAAALVLSRCETMARACIAKHSLDLTGLTVYTEAATGWYGYIPCIAAMAGAKVIAVAKNSAPGSGHGSAQDAMDHVNAVARAWHVSGIRTVDTKTPEDLSMADIITNNGHVRPLNRDLIAALKPTAVIPLMWESFEWREDELDLMACREHEILVLGTDEDKLDFFAYAAESMEKMLHTRSISMHGAMVLALGSGPFMAIIARELRRRGATVRCTATAPVPGETLLPPHSPELFDWLRLCDVVLLDERYTRDTILGPGGVLTIDELMAHRPDCVVLNHHGTLDGVGLLAARVDCCPHERTASWMIPTFTTNILGPRPVIRLMTAGLKVGEAMARARLAGMDLPQTIRHALTHSPAQDFPAPWAWLSEKNAERI